MAHKHTHTHLSTGPPIGCWIIIKLTPTTLREEKEKINMERERRRREGKRREEEEEGEEEEGGSGKREDTLDKDIPSVLMVESL